MSKKLTAKDLKKLALDQSREFYAEPTNDNVAVRTHDDMLKANLYKEISAFTYVERLLSDVQISDQSKRIASKLNDYGYDPYLPTDNQVSMVGLVTGAVFRFTPYRNINLIPEVAQRNRQPLLQEFDLFLKENPKIRRYARYMVVTSGERFPVYQFLERLDAFNKQIGRYISKSYKNQIDVILCSIEFTIDENKSINLHANIVSAPRKKFGRDGWSNWIKQSRRHFKKQMLHDAGRIKDTKEIVKYVCKFNEIAALGGQDMVEIARALYKKQLVRPLGLFREFRKDLKEKGQKVRYDNERKRLVRCQVSTRVKPETAEDFSKEEILDAAAAADAEKRKALASRYQNDKEVKEPIQNQILCKTLPQSRAALHAEPFVVVMNYTDRPTTRNGRDGLAAIEMRRSFHFRLLAEAGVEGGDLGDVGASRLDTLTIIPTRFRDEYQKVDPKRRKKLNRLLGLVDPFEDLGLSAQEKIDLYEGGNEGLTLEQVDAALLDALEQHFPDEYHDWSIDVADPVKLLQKGQKWHKEWLDQTAIGKAMYQEYIAARNDVFFDSANDNDLFEFDELDFIIPY